MANDNKNWDWPIYADLAHTLIRTARKLYASDCFVLELDNTVYALDATPIDLCLSMFPWANFSRTKGAIKLHTLLDLRGNIPTFIHISDGKYPALGEWSILRHGSRISVFCAVVRDFPTQCFFVIRAKSNLKCHRVYSHQINRNSGLICDQSAILTRFYKCKNNPDKPRRVKYLDATTDKTLVFLTNNFILPAITITQLYQSRWQVELFFRWKRRYQDLGPQANKL